MKPIEIPFERPNLTEAEVQHRAYSTAFLRLGLNLCWDRASGAADVADEKEAIRAFIRTRSPHLLKAYDADFLVDAVYSEKKRCEQQIRDCSITGTPVLWNWADECETA